MLGSNGSDGCNHHTPQALQCWHRAHGHGGAPQRWASQPSASLERVIASSRSVPTCWGFEHSAVFGLLSCHPFQAHSLCSLLPRFPAGRTVLLLGASPVVAVPLSCSCFPGKLFFHDPHVSPFQHPMYNFHFCIPEAVLLLSSSFPPHSAAVLTML